MLQPIENTNTKPTTPLGILLVGEPKSGKTRVGMGFPGVAVIDTDKNLWSATRLLPTTHKYFYCNPAVVSYAPEGVEVPVSDRWEHMTKWVKEAAKTPDVKVIFHDTLTTLAQVAIDHIFKLVKAQEGKDLHGNMRIQDYGTLAKLVGQYVTWLRTTGKIVIFSSHQTTEKDEITGVVRYKLAFPGRLADTLGGLFSDVWGLIDEPCAVDKDHPDSVKYMLRTRPSTRMVHLGTSSELPTSFDITNKSPEQIYAMVAKPLGLL